MGTCVECGAPLPQAGECWTRVHELLEIESRVLVAIDAELGMRTRFYAIGSYRLQHPSRSTSLALVGVLGDIAGMREEPLDDRAHVLLNGRGDGR